MNKTAAPPASREFWIHGPVVDLLVGCGAWSLPLIGIIYFLNSRDALAVALAFYALALFCNNPHYMATIVRAYGTRADFGKYRFFTIYVTLLIIFTGLIIHFVPKAFPILFTIYVLWSPWHYTGQNFGLAMMFARRTGVPISRMDRNLLHVSYITSYLVWFLGVNSADQSGSYIYTLGIPRSLAKELCVALFVIFAVSTVIANVRMIKAIGWRRMIPALVLLSTQFAWFMAGSVLVLLDKSELSPLFYTAGVLAFMHCAQYLWITSYYAKRETESGLRGPRKWNGWKYYGVLILGGIALFIPGPWIASRVFGHELLESYLIFASLVNIHHFILDGAIWKLRDGRIARLLLGKKSEPVGELPGTRNPAGFHLLNWLAGHTAGARMLRWGSAILLLLTASLDVWQYFLTLRPTNAPRLIQAGENNPGDIRVYLQRARLYLNSGQLPAALDEMKKAIDLNPYNASAQMLRGDTLTVSGKVDEAYAHYDRMTQFIRPDFTTLMNLSRLDLQSGDKDKAIARLEEAIRKDSGKPEALFALADLLFNEGNHAAAIPYYERYIQIQAREKSGENLEKRRKKSLEVAMKLAECYQNTGRISDAARWYKNCAQSAVSDKSWSISSIAWGRCAELELADPKEAMEYSKNAVRTALQTEDRAIRSAAFFNLSLLLSKKPGNLPHAYAFCLAAQHAISGSNEDSTAQKIAAHRATLESNPESEAAEVKADPNQFVEMILADKR